MTLGLIILLAVAAAVCGGYLSAGLLFFARGEFRVEGQSVSND